MALVCLAEWSPTIDMSKTERTSIPSLIAYRKNTGGVAHYTHAWVAINSVKTEDEDVAHRKQLAKGSFRQLWTLWFGFSLG